MPNLTPPPAWTSIAQGLLRVVSGFLLSLHGLSLIFGLFNTPGHPAKPAVAFTLIWFAGILQLVGGPLLAFGLFTRPVAFFLSGHLAVAYFLAHAPKGFWPILNGGELAALYSFVFLYLAFAGPGAFSLDGLIASFSQKTRTSKTLQGEGSVVREF
jgi:putative oxidoreductase